jgi:hypothetical protein
VGLADAVQLLSDDVRREDRPEQAVLNHVLFVLLSGPRAGVAALQTRVVQVDASLAVRARSYRQKRAARQLPEFLLRVCASRQSHISRRGNAIKGGGRKKMRAGNDVHVPSE